MTNRFKDWSRIKVKHFSMLHEHSVKRQREASQWLYDIGAEYQRVTGRTYSYWYLYIRDPKHETMFRLKFPDLLADHYPDEEYNYNNYIGPAVVYKDNQ